MTLPYFVLPLVEEEELPSNKQFVKLAVVDANLTTPRSVPVEVCVLFKNLQLFALKLVAP